MRLSVNYTQQLSHEYEIKNKQSETIVLKHTHKHRKNDYHTASGISVDFIFCRVTLPV